MAAAPLLIVTGASSNHFRSLCQLLTSLRDVQATIVTWDLGLTDEQRSTFAALFPSLPPLRRFDYTAYPAFYDITVNAGQYAWKSACIEEAMGGWPTQATTVLWLDAGNKLVGSLKEVTAFIQKQGLFSPISGGSCRDYIHPGTLQALGKTWADLKGCLMRNGAIIGFHTKEPWVREWFRTWRGWCNTEGILAPPGSDRSNHRQDQALLTISYAMVARSRGLSPLREFDCIKTHCDCD